MPEAWQVALREHVFPQLASSTLLALEAELASGGHNLIHRAFTSPPPLHPLSERKPQRVCLLGFCAVQEGHLATSAAVQDWIIDLGKKVGTCHTGAVMSRWDSNEAPMPELWDCVRREEFLEEVRLEMASRQRKTG